MWPPGHIRYKPDWGGTDLWSTFRACTHLLALGNSDPSLYLHVPGSEAGTGSAAGCAAAAPAGCLGTVGWPCDDSPPVPPAGNPLHSSDVGDRIRNKSKTCCRTGNIGATSKPGAGHNPYHAGRPGHRAPIHGRLESIFHKMAIRLGCPEGRTGCTAWPSLTKLRLPSLSQSWRPSGAMMLPPQTLAGLPFTNLANRNFP